MKIEKEDCKICCESKSKYKCPNCFLPYCSLACYKNHKEAKCSKDKKVVSNTQQHKDLPCNGQSFVHGVSGEDEEEETDRIPPETLHELRKSQHLVDILGNRHLQNLLQHVDQSELPGRVLEEAMHEPIFLEFVDQCLKVVEPKHTQVSVGHRTVGDSVI